MQSRCLSGAYVTPVIPEYAPMHPIQVREPFHREGWVYDEKLDGYRMLAYRDGKWIRLVRRNGVDHSKRFPELVTAIVALRSSSLVLDAEVAVFDQEIRSRFDWLRSPDPEAVASPPLLVVFDLLYRAGHDLSRRPLRERRERLGRSWPAASGSSLPRLAPGWRNGPRCARAVSAVRRRRGVR